MNHLIPSPIIAVVSDALAAYHNRTTLETLFQEFGAPGEPPAESSKLKMCRAWFRLCNTMPAEFPIQVLGKILAEYMEADFSELYNKDMHEKNRVRVNESLNRYGWQYKIGGYIHGAVTGVPTRSLENILKGKNLVSIEKEFERALDSIEKDPEATLTASCAIVESLCKIYIDDEHLTMPSDQSIKHLWKTVSKHIGFDPESIVDDDLKRILTGLSSIVDGLGSIRTHAGTAHGRGRKKYRIESRHARLANHAAHSLCVFIIETWLAKRK